MKTLLLTSTLLLAFSTLPAAAANDGAINFTGKLSTTTCLIEGQDPSAGGITKTVPMGEVPVGHLSKPGSSTTGKYFDIKVGGATDTGCANGVKAKVRFDPTSPRIDPVTGSLNIEPTEGAAKNVQIRIFNQGSSTPLHLLTDESRPVEIVSHQATLPFVADYYSAAGSATAGPANSTVGFQVIYE